MLRHAVFLRPDPPNLRMSKQSRHVPQLNSFTSAHVSLVAFDVGAAGAGLLTAAGAVLAVLASVLEVLAGGPSAFPVVVI